MNKIFIPKSSYFVLSLFIILFTVIIISFRNLSFIADDYGLIKYAINEIFPLGKWNGTNNYIRPVIIFTLHINYLFSGDNPFYYYITNLIFHIFNVILLYKILWYINTNVLKDIIKNKYYIYFLVFIFSFNPSALENIYWISGRTDIIVCTFLFSAFYFSIKYFQTNKRIYLLFVFFFNIVGILSKETFIIILSYLLIYYILNRGKVNKKRFLYFILVQVIFIIFYIIYRYSLLGIVGGKIPFYFSFYYLFKYSLYALWYSVFPVDAVDLYYSVINKPEVAIFVIVIVALFGFLLFKQLQLSKKPYIIIFSFLLIVLTFTIYVFSFPTLRLVYNIFPLSLFIGFYLIKTLKKYSLYLLLIYTLIIITGSTLNFIKITKSNDYSLKMKNMVMGETDNNENIIYLATICAIGHHPVFFEPVEIINFYNKSVFVNPHFHNYISFQFQTFDNIYDEVQYEFKNNNEIYITTKNKFNIILSPPFLLEDWKFSNNYYKFETDVELYIEEFSFRKGFAKKIKLVLPEYIINGNTDVVFFEDNTVKKESLKNFSDKFRRN